MISMGITTAAPCPIKCFYCPQSTFISAYKGERMMTWETFTTCIDKLPKKIRINFSGYCEGWVNPLCTDFLEYAAKGHPVAIYSTLRYCTKNDIERMLKVKYDSFTVHIPDADGATDFPVTDEYIELIKLIGQKANYLSHGRIHPKLYSLVKSTGKCRQIFCHDRAGNNNAGYSTPRKTGILTCRFWPDYDGGTLLPDGTVVLCCMDYGLRHVLGNLKFQPLEEITESEEAHKVRAAINSENGDCLCRNCPSACTPYERIRLIKELLDRGHRCGVSRVWYEYT